MIGYKNHMTPREREIHDLLIQGKSNKDIGRILGISHRTVEDHRSKIYFKNRVSNSTALVFKALSARIAELEAIRGATQTV